MIWRELIEWGIPHATKYDPPLKFGVCADGVRIQDVPVQIDGD